MKSEQEIRDWGVQLRAELGDMINFPTAVTGFKAAIDAVAWVLGDTPENDLKRVAAAAGEDRDEVHVELWMREPNDKLSGLTPLQCIVLGRADEAIAALRAPAGV